MTSGTPGRIVRSTSRLWVGIAAALLLGAGSSAAAQALKLEGRWWTPLGVMKISQEGVRVTGRMPWKQNVCPFKAGEEVFRAVLLEDSLSGQVRYCLKGSKDCRSDGWAPMVLLVAREGKVLSGAAHFAPTECKIGGKEKSDGIVMRRLKPKPPQPKPSPQVAGGAPDGGTIARAEPGANATLPDAAPVDDKGQPIDAEVRPLDPQNYEKNEGDWRSRMEEAKGQMESGFFERARKKFVEATELDPTRPEAFNGIGVTYYGRGDYEEALNWYKKALEVNSNFGDAYYNMACIYSLMKKNVLAFRYLKIAVLNGFVEHEAMQQDPDLENIRGDPEYQKILKDMNSGGKK